MIIAVERNLFNYIFKYNSILISIHQVIDISQEMLQKQIDNPTELTIKEFDRILPVFEQDHEILLLEVDKNELEFDGNIRLSFKAISRIFPLTLKAKNILSGKLNSNLEVDTPIFEKIIKEVKVLRALRNRELLIDKLFNILFLNEKPQEKFSTDVQLIIKSLLIGNSSSGSLLYHLLSYNYNPNEISSGNVEFFEKIGIITFSYIKGTSDGYTDSSFYKACEKNKKEINEGRYSDAYNKYFELLKSNNSDLNWSESHRKIDSIFNNEGYVNINYFKIAYYFLAIKTKLNKNDANLIELLEEIIEDVYYDGNSMTYVLYLIGYTFSFEQLYESIHILEKAPLLKNKFVSTNVLSIYKKLEEIDATNKSIEKDHIDTIITEINDSEVKKEDLREGKNITENENVTEWEINSNNSESSNVENLTIENTDTTISLNNISQDKIKLYDDKNNNDENKEIRVNEAEVVYTDIDINRMQEHVRSIDGLKKTILSHSPDSKSKEWELFFDYIKPVFDSIKSFDDFNTKLTIYEKHDKLKPSQKLLGEIENYFQTI
jgi:hypothetical protein